jgi:mevalonate kinase
MSQGARSGAGLEADAAVGRVTVRVPGKVMLAGEYSVLGGARALATPVAATMTVIAERAGDGAPADPASVGLVSSHWRAPRTLGRAAVPGRGGVEEPFAQTVRAALRSLAAPLARVEIRSELDPRHGLGSSSALRLGVTLAIRALALGRELADDERWSCAREAFLLQRDAQPRASGYDVAVQAHGGPSVFRQGVGARWPGQLETLGAAASARLGQATTVLVGGRGAATAPVMQDVLAWMADERHAATLAAANDALVDAYLALLAGASDGATRVIRATAAQRTVLEAAPHFPRALAATLREVAGLDATWSYKTTGAGGEDALLVVGDAAAAVATLAPLGWRPLTAPGGGAPFVTEGATLAVESVGDVAAAPVAERPRSASAPQEGLT